MTIPVHTGYFLHKPVHPLTHQREKFRTKVKYLPDPGFGGSQITWVNPWLAHYYFL